MPTMSTIPIQTIQNKTLETLALEKAVDLLKQSYAGLYMLHKGRKDLLMLMQKEPAQLALDIKRATKIIIGNKIINSTVNFNSPETLYAHIARALENYIKTTNNKIDNSNNIGRIGKFFTIEIIYSVVQSFLSPVQSAAHKQLIIFKNPGEWGAQIGTSEIIKSFELMPYNKNILVVSNISKKILINLSDTQQKKHFMTKALLFFDLSTGELKYTYEYSLDNHGKQWTLSTFDY